MQSEATVSDQTAHPAMATSTSLSAATPRTSRLLSHESASLMDAATAPNAVEDEKVLTYTADVRQSSETAKCISQPASTQSSQLDSALLSKLPRELRDKIYRDAVVEDKDVLIRVTPYVTEDGERRRRLEIGHPLMRVCKQTRQEVADIDHLENSFRITNDIFDELAIRELSRHLAPWAGKLKKLGISHNFVRSYGGLAKINFSISASQERIVVESESCSFQETISAFNQGRTTTNRAAMTFSKMCFCKIFKLALEHDCRDVLSWLQEYVGLVLKSQADSNTIPHCWTCAGRVII